MVKGLNIPKLSTLLPPSKKLCKGMTDAIILAADLPDDATFNIQLEAGEGLSSEIGTAFAIAKKRLELQTEQARLQEASLRSIHALREEGYSTRDIASALGITAGLVSQLAA
ncbi:hypothetical protein HMPREF9237_01767 [Actinotignum schaalii FB123-CNA-2]|uniref:Uncharacterized protein n=1 Tax=Actinotignum schaalii FB123-CNA-2 TaxID=883067 RepID=S2W0C6_9ACTO|nr:hypothetical protein HMPREF9237_01767 [Actinotignum schaalii FB123-CNA-2]